MHFVGYVSFSMLFLKNRLLFFRRGRKDKPYSEKFPICVYYRIVCQLVKRGADQRLRNRSGETPLDLAVEGKHADIVTL